VQLKRKGKELVGLCPFHEERSPSFHVNAERGVFRCHGCNKAGDVVTYVQQRYALNYQQANQWLKEFR
jgi:DNA primase